MHPKMFQTKVVTLDNPQKKNKTTKVTVSKAKQISTETKGNSKQLKHKFNLY